MSDIIGALYILNEKDNVQSVMVRWNNGYVTYGLIVDNIDNGHWYTFDKKNRLREINTISLSGTIMASKMFDKKGKQIAVMLASPPF